MANSTKDGNLNMVQELFCTIALGKHQKMFLLTFNIPLSINAFVGNVLIIVALKKLTSIHPPSKLLLGSLASTDMCVGLITQPIYVAILMSRGQSKRCYYLSITIETIGLMFCAISLLTLTAISVDRLLALLLGLRYRHVVTMRRVRFFFICSLLISVTIAIIEIFSFRIALIILIIFLLLCLAISTLCYMKIYFILRHHQIQVQDHVHQGQQNGGGILLNIARYRKTVSSALWIQMTLLACYLPYGIVTSIVVITGVHMTFLNHVAISLVLLNSSLTPLLYCWKMKEVRQAVKETIGQICC